MKLREALIAQQPSLELQRSAAIEIAALDHAVQRLQAELDSERTRTNLRLRIAHVRRLICGTYVDEQFEISYTTDGLIISIK